MTAKATVLFVSTRGEPAAQFIATLQRLEFDAQWLQAPDQLLEIADESAPDAIVLDHKLSALSALELCRLLKTNERTRHIPVFIFNDSARDARLRSQLKHSGAEGILTPTTDNERLVQTLTLAVRFKRLNDLGRRAADRLSDPTYTDRLTGLKNRRYFHERLHHEAQSSVRYHHPVSCALFEVDAFRHYVDKFGMDEGCDLLAEIGIILNNNTRSGDIAARQERGMFAVLLPHTAHEDAIAYAHKIRRAVEERFSYGGKILPVATLSAGVATIAYMAPSEGEDLFANALRALRLAQTQGINTVVSFENAAAYVPDNAQ